MKCWQWRRRRGDYIGEILKHRRMRTRSLLLVGRRAQGSAVATIWHFFIVNTRAILPFLLYTSVCPPVATLAIIVVVVVVGVCVIINNIIATAAVMSVVVVVMIFAT